MFKKKKLCNEQDHDWVEFDKCKDYVSGHPCEYHPEGCPTCMTRFECHTKGIDTYNTRLTGIFYYCKKCPAIRVKGYIYSWKKQDWNSITDGRDHYFRGQNEEKARKIADKWNGK